MHLRRRLVGLAALLAMLAGCASVQPVYTIPPVRLGEPSFFPTLEAHTKSPIEGGNRVEILLDGDETFPVMLRLIRGARRTITLAQYFFEDGDISWEITQAVAERCRAGLGVKVLLDAFGSLALPAKYPEALRRAGCHLAYFRPLRPWKLHRYNHRNHRRVLVVDGRTGITGGIGFSDKWRGDGRVEGHWRDTNVLVEGPVVRQLQAAFAESWLEATGMVVGDDPYFPRLSPVGDVYAQVVSSSPARGAFQAYMLFLLSIQSARRSILLTNPYFVPDARMVEALLTAVGRGVRVVVLVPGEIDHNLVREASRAQFGELLQAGIKIYEYRPALLHAKTMVVDGLWATVGSTNLDNRSFALNEELQLTVYDAGLARRMEQIFSEDVKAARRVTYEAWTRRPLTARVLELFVLPIRDLL
jgi:cardiolipin synthase